MKIRIIIPISGLNVGAIEERMKYLRSLAHRGTEIDYVVVEKGPPAIESAVDHAQASAEVLEYVKEADEDGCGAAIIWCGGDPGLEAARTLVDIPVIGPGESMELLASLVGKKVCEVPAPLPVLDLRVDEEKTFELTRKSVESLMNEGYDSFYLGCLGMWGMGKRLRGMGLPVIDGAEAAIKMAEVAIELGLNPSRIAYPKYPPAHRMSKKRG